MPIVLNHHPWSRAATTVWMLEEVGEPYTLRHVDLRAGAHKEEAHKAKNRMMKLPVIEDGDAIVSESAAIGVYLADKYALGRLAPALDDPKRGAYLRWCFFAPTVIEPACMAKASGWEYSPSSAGFGTYDDMVATLEEGLAGGAFLLGDFTMADIIVGSTVRFMMQFNMMEGTDVLRAYSDRLAERPALQRADAKNAAILKELGLG